MGRRTLNRQARPLVFVTTEDGCFIPLSHQTNQDGYFRKTWNTGADRVAEMFHRFIWRAKRGEIPEGYEINHLCGNRACQNVDHMECIDGTVHAVKTNKERYSHIHEKAYKEWKRTNCKPSFLAKTYGWAAYGWVRKWKLEENNCNNP